LAFGAILKQCRERAGLTQEQMAERLHRSRSCISKIESDKKGLDVTTFMQWADATCAKEVMIAALCGVDPSIIVQNIQNIMSLLGVS
jgi:transcriptional regulator with XRE-family HTH domain